MDTKKVKEKYNHDIVNKFGSDYENKRWFINDIQKGAYEMTLASIKEHVLSEDFSDCVELGPGHGTWTNFLLESHRSSSFDLVDISEQMLNLVKKRFGDNENVRYFESDFLQFEPDKSYDFFFSSRAIEYIPDKNRVVKKMLSLIESGGSGFLITKTPKYMRNKILRRTISHFHQGQILPRRLAKILVDSGAGDVRVYPVTFSFPLVQSVFLNKLLHKLFYKIPLNFMSQFFAESYCVTFKKL